MGIDRQTPLDILAQHVFVYSPRTKNEQVLAKMNKSKLGTLWFSTYDLAGSYLKDIDFQPIDFLYGQGETILAAKPADLQRVPKESELGKLLSLCENAEVNVTPFPLRFTS